MRLLSDLSDLEESYYAKELFSHIDKDNEFNMLVDYTVYKMNYSELGREYGICAETVKRKINKKINQLKIYRDVLDKPISERGKSGLFQLLSRPNSKLGIKVINGKYEYCL